LTKFQIREVIKHRSFFLFYGWQVMNEQQQLADLRQKFSASKRYDPKYRALTEAIRLMEEEEEEGVGDDVVEAEPDGDGDCLMPPPSTSPKLNICYPPHPKQRHLSNSLAIATASTSTTPMTQNTPVSQR
jgi:hypothetical protein